MGHLQINLRWSLVVGPRGPSDHGCTARTNNIVLNNKLTPPLILASNSHWNKIRTYSTNLQIIGFQNLLELTQYLGVALKDQGFLSKVSLLYSRVLMDTLKIQRHKFRINTYWTTTLTPLILVSNSHWNKIRTYSTTLQIIGFRILLELTQSLVVLKDQGFLSLQVVLLCM